MRTDHGFIILQPNVRGSTGYGLKFRDACINDFGGKDLDDIESGVKFLKSLPYVDPDRIGISGVSYGGYLTYIALTKRPDIFKAGIPIVGITSLSLLYETCQKTFPFLAHYMEEQMGKPDNEKTIKLWEDRSAINFVQNLTAKIKIIHTANDPRCPVDQAEVFREKLLNLGKEENKDFEYVVFQDQGHGTADIGQSIQWMGNVIEFLEIIYDKKYLLKRFE